MVTSITSVINKISMDKLLKTGLTPEILFSFFQCQIFPEYLLTSDPVKPLTKYTNTARLSVLPTIGFVHTEDEKNRMGLLLRRLSVVRII